MVVRLKNSRNVFNGLTYCRKVPAVSAPRPQERV